jgi:SAM-dependent methyltransferase
VSAADEKVRAVSFGTDAEAYERARPGYPDEIADDLAVGAVDVVDVGCGTGKLGRLLVERGCNVLGVEPDERMAAVARRFGLDVEVAPFETWDAAGRRFDLVAAAQAWHWVDPQVGAERAADLLRLGGRLAVVWNLTRHQPQVKVLLDEAYQRIAPELLKSVAIGVELGEEPLAGVDETGAFGPQARQVVAWQRRYTTAEWLDQLPTHSDHRALEPERRAALLAAVRDAVDAVGGSLTVSYTTLCITATRR